jgi:UDP-N-acetylglucosamine 2-epimerase (non-hydrolysing)
MKNNPLLICFGTRPEWLKIKPLIKLMAKGEYKLLFTGQHPDLLRDIKVDYQINMSSGPNRLDLITSDCILQFPKGEFKGVLVQGDTGSAFGCALAAFNRQLKIYYLEAGLRSYDLQHPYPEEGYRQMISRISDINFSPTTTSLNNLRNEKTKGDIFVVGNSVLDNLIEYKNKCEYNNKVLVTLHRRENLHWINEWFKNVNDLSKQNPHLDFILPLHPNPNIQKHKHLLSDVKVIEPLSHPELLDILVKCRLVISDSGGLQEEGTFLNKKVIVCRKTTERPEAISTGHLFLCKNPNELKGIFGELIDNYYIDTKCPYGEGNTANLVYKILKNEERF